MEPFVPDIYEGICSAVISFQSWTESGTFLVAECRGVDAVTALLQCLVLQGEIKEGERPRGRHCRMRPSLLLASPTWTWPWSLRSSASVIQSSALAVQTCQNICLLAQKVFESVLEWRMNGVWWRFSAPLAEAQRVSHKESGPGRK